MADQPPLEQKVQPLEQKVEELQEQLAQNAQLLQGQEQTNERRRELTNEKDQIIQLLQAFNAAIFEQQQRVQQQQIVDLPAQQQQIVDLPIEQQGVGDDAFIGRRDLVPDDRIDPNVFPVQINAADAGFDQKQQQEEDEKGNAPAFPADNPLEDRPLQIAHAADIVIVDVDPDEKKDIANILPGVFGDDFKQISEINNLNIDTIKRIALKFQNEINQVQPEDITGVDEIIEEIKESIADPRLKRILINDLLIRKSENEHRLGDIRPTQIIPVTSDRDLIVTGTLRSNISDFINKELQIQEPAELAGIINEFIDETNLRVAGRRPNIELTTRERDNRRRRERGERRRSRENIGVALDDEDIKEQLLQLSIKLQDNTAIFTSIPIIGEDESKPTTPGETVRLIRQDIFNKKRKSGMINTKNATEIGNISVISTRGELSSDLQIIIPRNAQIKDLLIFIQTLLMTDGVLKNNSGKTIIAIQRGLTNMQDVLKVIEIEINKMGNQPVMLIYKPNSLVGGSYVGGALNRIINRDILGMRKYKDYIPPVGIPTHNKLGGMLRMPLNKVYRPSVGGALTQSVNITNTPFANDLFRTNAAFSTI